MSFVTLAAKTLSYLEIISLNKSFGPRQILRAVNAVAQKGATIALTGVSGAGKSTLLNILAGLERAESGTVRVGDTDVTSTSAAKLATWRAGNVGLVFQGHHLLPDLLAWENVALPLRIKRANSAEARRQAWGMLSQLGLEQQAAQPVGQLSGGEQQRVALARALVGRPGLVLADEPTGQLDDATGTALVSLLLENTRMTGATLILATHNPRWLSLCERRWHLSEGTLSGEI